jgi:hypothetical protein
MQICWKTNFQQKCLKFYAMNWTIYFLLDDLPTKMYCHNNSYTNAVAYSKKYIRIKYRIEKHYTNRWKTWLAQAYNTHFNTPWTMIAFLAASLALLLTLIQTWCAIHPNN